MELQRPTSVQEPSSPCPEAQATDAPLELQHLPPCVVVAVYDCLSEAADVIRAATVCKTIWNIVAAAQFTKVASIRFNCFHPELQHRIPNLAQQFPAIQTLNLADCSALPESWLQQAAAVWKIRYLDITRMWHWTGAVCLPHWADSLTRLVASQTSFPIGEAIRQQQSAVSKHTAADPTGTGTSNSVPAAEAATSSNAAEALHGLLPQQQSAGQQHSGQQVPQKQGTQQLAQTGLQCRARGALSAADAAGSVRAGTAGARLAKAAMGAAGLSVIRRSQEPNTPPSAQLQQQNISRQQSSASDGTAGLPAHAQPPQPHTPTLAHQQQQQRNSTARQQDRAASGGALLSPIARSQQPHTSTLAHQQQQQQNIARQQDLSALGSAALLAVARSQQPRPQTLAYQHQQNLNPSLPLEHDHPPPHKQHIPEAGPQQTDAEFSGQWQGKQQGQRPQPIAWARELCNLRELHLSGLVRDPVRCRTHGTRDCHCEEDTVLSTILSNNSTLTHLDLSSNHQLPDRILQWALTGNAVGLKTLDLSGCDLIRPGYVGSCCWGLEHLNLSGTSTTDADVIMISLEVTGLTYLSLKECRQVSDFGIRALSSSRCVFDGHLQYLNLGGLTRTHSSAMVMLMTALVGGCSSIHPRHSTDSTWSSPSTQRDALQLGESPGGSRLLHLGLSYTAGASDSVLSVFAAPAATANAAAAAHHTVGIDVATNLEPNTKLMNRLTLVDHKSQPDMPSLAAAATTAAVTTAGAADSKHRQARVLLPIGLSRLELAGCNNISGAMLQHVASLGLLQGLGVLDVSDMEDLRSPNSLSPATRTGAAAAAAAAATQGLNQSDCGDSLPDPVPAGAAVTAPHSILGQVFRHTGSQITSLTLDGTYVNDLTARFMSQQCPVLDHLSVVGCKGLGTDGLRALVSSGGHSGGLRSLYIGGSSSLWREREALSALTSLTELRVFRRSSVTDADLAPVLWANQQLLKLTLVGCYRVTDQLFVLANIGSNISRVDDDNVGTPLSALPSVHELHSASGSAEVGLSHLTQLNLTACDGIRGVSMSRLRNLRSLRISFCAAIDKTAIQHLVVACKNLVLLELPAQLQAQVNAQTFSMSTAAADGGGSSQPNRNSLSPGSRLFRPGVAGANSRHGVLLPKQGLGGHLHGLKVVCV